MAKVARSSFAQANINRLRFHKIKVFIQQFAGNFDTEASRTPQLEDGENIEYSVYIDGVFSQSGLLADDGSAILYIPSGKQALLTVLGTQFPIIPAIELAASNTLEGVQQRLTLLGYLSGKVQQLAEHELAKAVARFEVDYAIALTGNALNKATYTAIDEAFRQQDDKSENQTEESPSTKEEAPHG